MELAKYFEHKCKSYQLALNYVEELIRLMEKKENRFEQRRSSFYKTTLISGRRRSPTTESTREAIMVWFVKLF